MSMSRESTRTSTWHQEVINTGDI